VQVARVIMEPSLGFVVKYPDGDKLNLTRRNLYVAETSLTRAKACEQFFGVMPEPV
jgi:hypothetical protein